MRRSTYDGAVEQGSAGPKFREHSCWPVVQPNMRRPVLRTIVQVASPRHGRAFVAGHRVAMSSTGTRVHAYSDRNEIRERKEENKKSAISERTPGCGPNKQRNGGASLTATAATAAPRAALDSFTQPRGKVERAQTSFRYKDAPARVLSTHTTAGGGQGFAYFFCVYTYTLARTNVDTGSYRHRGRGESPRIDVPL